mgnify:CR=1 FL=1
MKFKQFTILLTAFVFLSFELPKHLQKKVDKEIKDTYNVEVFEFKSKIIDAKVASNLPSKFGSDNLFEIKSKTKTIGYAYVSKAPSKTDEFDYLVLLDTDLIVKKAVSLNTKEKIEEKYLDINSIKDKIKKGSDLVGREHKYLKVKIEC